MDAVWQYGPKHALQKFILLAIADFADNNGKAWPSVKTLAERCSVNETTIRRNLRQLEKGGWLETDKATGRYKTNQYQISPKVMQKAGDGVLHGGRSASQPVTRYAQKKSFLQEMIEACSDGPD